MRKERERIKKENKEVNQESLWVPFSLPPLPQIAKFSLTNSVDACQSPVLLEAGPPESSTLHL